MPILKTLHTCPSRRLIPALAVSWLAFTAALQAATIEAGNITTVLGPTFFIEDTINGGSDADINQPNAPAYNRYFSGLLATNQGPTKVVLTGLGFAAHPSKTANDATSIAVTFTYLGADEAVNGGDDIVIGTATGNYIFTDGGEYVFAFDTPLSADLTITGTRFRIQIAPSKTGGDGSLKLKTGSTSEPQFSVAGTTAPLITPQRVNLAKFQSVTASTTTGQYRASYLTDGVTGNDNRWQSGNSAWNTARIDFPFPVEVGSAQVFTGVDDTNPIANYSIQYLNGATWTAIPGASANPNTNVERNLVFTNPITASSFRLIGQDAPLNIRELALYPPNGPTGFPLGTDLTINLAHQRPADASANTAGNFALHALDGRTNGYIWQTTTTGTNTLDIDLRVSTKIGSAHLYSGSTGVSPLANFTLRYWNGSAWQNITGGTVNGNTSADRVVSFTPVTTSMVRLSFTNPGTTSIRELCIFPANTGNTGYPLGTSIIGSGLIPDYEKFNDAFYQITNPASARFISMPGSQPVLNQAGITTEQGQYQVLLNLSNGTYRLRNRDTGNCLSGAQLSKTAGLPLTDAPYTALPDQDWILDPLGNDDFRFINQWSGLVIDTQGSATTSGTPLVQNTANSNSPTQRWRFSNAVLYPKKGIGGTFYARATDPDWTYNWGRLNTNAIPADTSFHPMQWGSFSWDIGSDQGPLWQNYPNWRKRSDGVHLLGFNEPDRTDQSNMTLSQVVSLWPRLQELDLPLVSPAPGTSSWLSGFYTQADALGYRVDYTAVHTYPGPSGGSADNLIDFVNSAYTYNSRNRPVWLTEFSFVDWDKNQSWSEEDNYNCLAEFLWRAEGNDKLRKYALFVFTESAEYPLPANPWQNFTPAPRSNSYDINGNLTAFGKLYAAWDNVASVQSEKPYMIHHRGLSKRMANAATINTAPGGRTIRTDGAIVNWTLVSTGVSNRYYVVSSIDGRRLSYVTASNPNNDPALVAAGTTGVNVEWSLTHKEHGWYYLGHPHTSTRLKMVSYDTGNTGTDYQLVAASTTDDSVQWRFIVPAPPPIWTGTAGSSWADPDAWFLTNAPVTGDLVTFNDKSTANLTSTLDQNFSLSGILFQNPTGPVSIGGTHNLTLGTSGIDLSAATQNLTITAPSILSAAQTWNVAAGRTLSVNGGVTGAFALDISGAGTTSLGGAVGPLTPLTIGSGSTLKTTASSVLASGATALNPTLDGTLDLNGTSQSINFLTGSGVITNSAVGAASLTLGSNNTGGTLSALVQNTGGPLTLIKTGTASLILPIANTHTGGFTNNGSGNVTPQNNAAFGSGPVVMNGATIYATAANYTFTNALTLNAAILRVGGSNSRILTWDGPVTATGASGISADGGTTGVTINGSLDITGATFTSTSSSQNNINGPISGAGGNLIAQGNNCVLQLAGTNTYGGTTTITDGSFLRLTATGTLPPSSNITNNGGLTIRNTVSWIHNGTITGDGSASISLNTGTNATLAGNISNITTINVDNAGTNTTISGAIGSATNINILGTVDGNGLGAILRLGGNNTYSGTTTITRGKLILAASNVLPNTTAVSIGNATLDATTFTDTAGTLDVTSTATIHLGPGAALAFADSSGISWSGGSLNITGTFISGSSIRFGTSASALTSTQLGLITVNSGTGPFTLNASGFLIAPVTNPYDVWKTQITNGLNGRTQDADFDGYNNLQEFLFGTSPIAGNGSLVSTTVNGNNLILRWLQRETAATYTLKQTTTLAAGSWTNVPSPLPASDADQSGTPANYDRFKVTLPISGGKLFYRVEGVEN
jgi:autotransporter-associated beta strand protein